MPTRMMIYTIVKLFVGITGGLFLFTFIVLMRNSYLPRWLDKTLPSVYNLPYKKIEFFSTDRLPLKGWLILKNHKLPTIILCHGLGTNKSDLLEFAKFLYEADFNVFLFDFRGHGESQGKTCSFGYLEQRDLMGAINYLDSGLKLVRKEFGVFGLSMGAAVGVMVASFDSRVKALIAESAYKDLYSSMRYHAKLLYRLPEFPFAIFLRIAYFLRFWVDPQRISPKDVIGKISPRPLFIITGERDEQIPPENAKVLFKGAKEPKQLWVIPQAGHGEGFALYQDEYKKRIIKFFKDAL